MGKFAFRGQEDVFMDFRDASLSKPVSRARRQFISSHGMRQTAENIRKTLPNLENSSAAWDMEGQIDALGEIIVCCLAGFEAIGCDTEEILRRIVAE